MAPCHDARQSRRSQGQPTAVSRLSGLPLGTSAIIRCTGRCCMGFADRMVEACDHGSAWLVDGVYAYGGSDVLVPDCLLGAPSVLLGYRRRRASHVAPSSLLIAAAMDATVRAKLPRPCIHRPPNPNGQSGLKPTVCERPPCANQRSTKTLGHP